MRVSYSILKKVEQGELDIAFNMLMGIQEQATLKMLEGKRLHEEIETKKIALLPVSDNLKYEYKVEMEIQKDLILVGVVDLYDVKNAIIYDWKYTGRKITEYDEMQLFTYSILIPEAKMGILAKIDKTPKVKELYGKEFTIRSRKKAIDWVIKLSNILKEFNKFNY